MQVLNVVLEPYAELPQAYIAHFEGDFDGGAYGEGGAAKSNSLTDLQAFIDSAPAKLTLILDFSKLNFLNSYAIGHLVSWHQHLSALGGTLSIVGTNKNVEDIFAIVGISKLFKIFPDLAAATSALK